ncbi:MAG TPA: MlaD family protein [Sphingobium sp.]|uniref:MlaD family protein n=1 Tax=Sphingobium sp. TaxID=1912891 RepID=UPI002ED30A8C
METRSNHILVGTVTLILLAAIVIAAFWFSRIGEGDNNEYDVFFKSSVSGLAKGSAVSYSGVPAGQVKLIELWKKDPNFVRVRLSVKNNVPVLQGTTATIQSLGFTGVSEIQLDGGVKGAPAITCPTENLRSACPEGVPVIPTKPGALGQLLNNAPQLLERLTTLSERLTELLSDKNQASIAGILDNTNALTKSLAARGPDIAATLAQARIAVKQTGDAAEQIGNLAGTTNQLLNEQGKPLMADLRETVKSAKGSMDALDATIKDVQPGVQAFSQRTMPEVGLLIRDLRRMSQALQNVAEKIDQQGASSIIGSPALPDYKK